MLAHLTTRRIILLLAVLFAVVVLATRVTFLWVERRETIANAETATQHMAIVLQEYAERRFEAGDVILRDVLDRIQDAGGISPASDTAVLHRLLAAQAERTRAIDYILVIDAGGTPIAISSEHPVDPIDLSDRKWMRAHQAGAQWHIGEAIFSRLTDNPVFTYSRRVDGPSGAMEAVVQVSIRPTFLDETPAASTFGRDLSLGIWRADGSLVAQSGLAFDDSDSPVYDAEAFAGVHAAPAGTYHVRPEAGGKLIVSYRRLEDWPIVVSASVPLRAALVPWRRSVGWSAVVLGFVLTGLGGLTWIGLRESGRERRAKHSLEAANGRLGAALAEKDSLIADKEALIAEKEMLFREIHHRVRNNLQVTASLLQMQARRFEDPDVRAAFQETQTRLRAIGLIHETLYRNDGATSVELSDYLGRLIGELSAAYGAQARNIEIALELEPIRVGLDRAVPIALSVTEALTNVFKHAFAPDQGGRILVRAKLVEGEIELTIRDTGRGMPSDADQSSSLGMRLIRAFSTQLGGHFSFADEDGTVFRLVAPVNG